MTQTDMYELLCGMLFGRARGNGRQLCAVAVAEEMASALRMALAAVLDDPDGAMEHAARRLEGVDLDGALDELTEVLDAYAGT